MKKLVFLFAFALAIFAPSHSFAIVATTHQTAVSIEKPVSKEFKKSTKITLLIAASLIGLSYILKAIGVSSGILAGCYILALIACILCIGSLFQK